MFHTWLFFEEIHLFFAELSAIAVVRLGLQQYQRWSALRSRPRSASVSDNDADIYPVLLRCIRIIIYQLQNFFAQFHKQSLCFNRASSIPF